MLSTQFDEDDGIDTANPAMLVGHVLAGGGTVANRRTNRGADGL
jgi:hypothetical protein